MSASSCYQVRILFYMLHWFAYKIHYCLGMNHFSRFFTLVELLVVVSIVSILSSVGFSGFQTARAKAIDGTLKETLSSTRNIAGIYHTTTGSYGTQATTTGFVAGSSGIFSDPKMVETITSAERLSGGQASYVSDDSSYAISIPLRTDPAQSWCVDSMGHSGIIDGTIITTSCASAASVSEHSGGSTPSALCPASGGCVETISGGTCTSYSTSTVVSPDPCSAVQINSSCNNGVWSVTPGGYSSCTASLPSSCPALGACGAAVSGATCNSFPDAYIASPGTCPNATISTCTNGTWFPIPHSGATCVVTHASCPASGGCPLTSSGGSCTTYSALAPAGTCASIARTSTCTDGVWSSPPQAYATCSSSWCPSNGLCPATADGGYCITYPISVANGNSCGSQRIVSYCSSGVWSTPPGPYATCSDSCPANGVCPATVNGGPACISYPSPTANGTECMAQRIVSYCNYGVWSTPPGPHTTCSNDCPTEGLCSAASHGSSCITYPSPTANGTSCGSQRVVSYCNFGVWSPSPAGYASCSNNCPSNGLCPATADGGYCITYPLPVANGNSCLSLRIVSYCSSGAWSTPPGSYATCSNNCLASGGCGPTADGGSCITYPSPTVTGISCLSVRRVSYCSSGAWSITPYSYASCVQVGG